MSYSENFASGFSPFGIMLNNNSRDAIKGYNCDLLMLLFVQIIRANGAYLYDEVISNL